jgi:hypothetical protein
MHDAVNLGNEDIVATDKTPVSNLAVKLRKRIKIIFVEGVFDVYKVIAVDQLGNI